ncbi:hypothetical protein VTI28DRAFT_9203 [Corynascus sepedonium]
MDWAKDQYHKQYNIWVPWLEDLYLRYFTRDNKASYIARDNLDKTKVTNISEVDALQDSANDIVAGQVGQDGLGRPAGDLLSQEGINRIERKGMNEDGQYLPSSSSVVEGASTAGEAVAGAGVAVVGGVIAGGRQAAGAVGGLFERSN